MKDWRFWMGSVFGAVAYKLVESTVWPLWGQYVALVMLFIIAQYLVHQIAES